MSLIDTEMRATGPSWACRVVLAASRGMRARSTSVIRLGEGGEVEGDARLEVRMGLPRWVPVPVERVRKGGQSSMDDQVEKDLRDTVETLAGLEVE